MAIQNAEEFADTMQMAGDYGTRVELVHARDDAIRAEREAFAWVIERGDSRPDAPTYWAGPDRWSQAHMDAIRFVRRHDAERVAMRLGQGYHRVAEHGWLDRARAQPAERAKETADE